MIPSQCNILVHFQDEVETPLGLHIPERYVVHSQGSDEDNETRMGVTTDRRLINPQVVDVLSGEYDGQSAFVYYGAYETAIWPDEETAIIKSSHVLFLTNPIRPMPGIYLGEEVFVEGDRTDSGIYRSPNVGGLDGIKVKLLHTPPESSLRSGDTVVTQDSAQYWLLFEGVKYLMVRYNFIAGYYRDGELHPFGTNLLVERLPNSEDEARRVKNERIQTHIDFMRKHNMHYDPKEFVPVEESKIIPVRILSGEHKGETALIHRSGVKIDNLWVVEKDALCGLLMSNGIDGATVV